jgi:hypothetical protein
MPLDTRARDDLCLMSAIPPDYDSDYDSDPERWQAWTSPVDAHDMIAAVLLRATKS